jgi:hypothetical protein
MKNILLAIDSSHVDMSTLDFACYVARLTHSGLTGYFLENIRTQTIPVIKSMHGLPFLESVVAGDLPEGRAKFAAREKSMELFRNACCNKGVNCSTAVCHGPAKDIIQETRFADLLIVSPSTSFESRIESTPTAFVREVLAGSECPVAIAPYSFEAVDEILFAFDGSRSSVFAIKQFVYLFPEFRNRKVTVLEVKESGREELLQDRERISRLLAPHYDHIEFCFLEGYATDELFGYLLGKKNLFVVMGAFGRSPISNFFNKSTAELLLKTINLPVFTAHH